MLGAPKPKSGYGFFAMAMDENGNPYRVNLVGGIPACNDSKYGFCGVPFNYNTAGVRVYIVNEMGVVYARDTGAGTPVMTWPNADPSAVGWVASD